MWSAIAQVYAPDCKTVYQYKTSHILSIPQQHGQLCCDVVFCPAETQSSMEYRLRHITCLHILRRL
jgi:hypothetical protein